MMGFCTDEEYREFLHACPQFERMLIRSGTMLVKYWFSVNDKEQIERFEERLNDPTKHWKLSPMDLESLSRWVDYSKAKDEMFSYTDIKESPWYVVNADNKRCARLNCIRHLLSMIPYKDVPRAKVELPKKDKKDKYVRPPMHTQTFVPEYYVPEGS